MRILLTGATGFVGSHLARLLVNEGCDVAALIRPGSGTARIDDVLPRLHVIPCDLNDVSLDAHLERLRPALCLHLAWHVTAGGAQTGLGNVDSLTGSLRLATRLAEGGCRRMVVTGSCFEYAPSARPFMETDPVAPTSLYEAAKISLSLVLEQLSRETGMETAWLRVFPLYGPWEDPRRLVPAVILSLLRGEAAETTGGAQVRDYLHVADAAAAIWAVAQSGLTGSVNIGSGQPVTLARVVETIAALTGRPDLLRLGAKPYRADEARVLTADIARLRGTSRHPHFSLEDGLAQTVAWWRRPQSSQPVST